MWCRIALCLVLGGCGFHSDPEIADSGAGNGSSDCLQRWFDGSSLTLSAPVELTALAADGDNRDPWISADGLQLYFGRNPGAHGDSDIYLATRTSPAMEFGNPGPVDNLDTAAAETRAAVNGDNTLLMFSSNRGPSGSKFQLFVSARPDTAQPFPSPAMPDQMLVTSVNAANVDYFDPFLSKDGLRLYLAPRPVGAMQQIAMATRMPGQNFGLSTPVAMINSGMGDADPAVSPDERIIVFSSMRPAGKPGMGATNLWYATRQNAADNFTAPQLIPMVNSDTDDGDPMLSADGCELYFASKRVGGRYQLFHAQVMK